MVADALGAASSAVSLLQTIDSSNAGVGCESTEASWLNGKDGFQQQHAQWQDLRCFEFVHVHGPFAVQQFTAAFNVAGSFGFEPDSVDDEGNRVLGHPILANIRFRFAGIEGEWATDPSGDTLVLSRLNVKATAMSSAVLSNRGASIAFDFTADFDPIGWGATTLWGNLHVTNSSGDWHAPVVSVQSLEPTSGECEIQRDVFAAGGFRATVRTS